MRNPFDSELFRKLPVIGILRHFPPKALEQTIPLFLAAGFTTLEVTLNSQDAEKCIRNLSRTYPQLQVGAGTVCGKKDLKRALRTGASFIVSPIAEKKVIQACVREGIPVFPGAFTPREIYLADLWGAAAVKVFPAGMLGPGYIREILAPLQHLRLLPTGGVTAATIPAYFQAGAYGVGMGSTLFPSNLIAAGNPEDLMRHFATVAKAVQDARIS